MARRKRKVNFPPVTASTAARGYGAVHEAEWRRWKPLVEAGEAVCVRCGLLILPGTAWHLDHTDDKLGFRGVSHARCNVKAAARLGSRRAQEKKLLGEAALEDLVS
jgi:hypothetical protein